MLARLATKSTVIPVLLTALMGLPGCRTDGAAAIGKVELVEGNAGPIRVEIVHGVYNAVNATLVSATVRTPLTHAVTIRDIDVVSDPGLKVTYLGHADCSRGCPGAVDVNPETEEVFVKRGLNGRYPVELLPNAPPEWLVFRLETDGNSGTQELVRHCGLYVRRLVLRLSDGSKVSLRDTNARDKSREDWVLGAHVTEPYPPGLSPDCERR